VLYAKIEPRTGGISTSRRGDFFERVVNRLARVPGVDSASATDSPPLAARSTIFLNGASFDVCALGYRAADPRDAQAELAAVAPRYFATMRIPVIAGREFEWRDRATATTNVAIVNETFARRFFRGGNPLEGRFGLNCPAAPAAIAAVGVVADVKEEGPRQPPTPKLYLPLGNNGNVLTLVLRTAGRPELMIPTLRRTVAELSAAILTFGEITPVALREQQMRQERLLSNLLVAFGAVALALSAMGIHGMLGYTVVRRTSEIGVRMALGATPSAVVMMVVKESIAPVLCGLAAGALGAAVAARWIKSFLFEVSGADAATIAAGAAILLAVAAIASVIPARRAARVDPLRALRTE
jgi:putative ABC transport system permease protein